MVERPANVRHRSPRTFFEANYTADNVEKYPKSCGSIRFWEDDRG